MTLVELLVVIVLVTTLVTTAIPILSPGGDSRKIREASRAVNSFFAGAQARAIETGRPYGVAIKRLSAVTGNADDNGVGVELAYVEVPPVYAGISTTSRCRLCEDSNLRQIQLQFMNYGTNEDDRLPPGWDLDPVPGQFLRPGDTIWVGAVPYLIENGDGNTTVRTNNLLPENDVASEAMGGYFDAVGTSLGIMTAQSQQTRFHVIPLAELARTTDGGFGYRVLSVGERFNVNLSPRYDNRGDELPPPETLANALEVPFWTEPTPYKIYRQPVPAQGQPLQLPAGAAIDLAASGFAGDRALHRGGDAYGTDTPANGATPAVFSDDVVVMFSPEGSIESMTFRPRNSGEKRGVPSSQTINATSSLALLVGRRELIPPERDPNDATRTEDEPINVNLATYREDFEGDATREKFAKYNWLNLDSRWVVIGAQTGSVTTVENASINVADLPTNPGDPFGLEQQMAVVRANAPSRLTAGGR